MWRLGQSARHRAGRFVLPRDPEAGLRNRPTDVVRAIARLSKFYMHESCGQCTPCREGTGWMYRIVDRLAQGEGSEADIALLMDIAAQVGGHTICGLGDAAAGPVRGLINNFRTIVEDRIAPPAMPEAA